ncbi:sodium-dependent glucose transporter 1A-like [Littorina saxatilis]|uniref:sodium-dependent glucose transporter 1A-like n=1 Tax=Littorina saxatilis TaxID=31220 RepID=UPI0038B4F5F8
MATMVSNGERTPLLLSGHFNGKEEPQHSKIGNGKGQGQQNGIEDGDLGNWRSRLRDAEYRQKFTRSIWLCLCFISLGVVTGQFGPSFLDLQLITHTNVQQASAFFTAASAGNVAGSLVSGVIYDVWDKSLLLILCVLLMGVMALVLPFCSRYWVMVVACFLVTTFGGSVGTVCNADVLRTWGLQGEAVMQAAHFAFAFGGVVAPFITQPFLAPRNITTDLCNNQSHLHLNHTDVLCLDFVPRNAYDLQLHFDLRSTDDLQLDFDLQNDLRFDNNVTSYESPRHSRIHFAYVISSIISFLSAIPLSVEYVRDYCRTRKQTKKTEKDTDNLNKYATIASSSEEEGRNYTERGAVEKDKRGSGGDPSEGEEKRKATTSGGLNLPRVPHAVVVVWMCVFYLVFVAVEMTVPYYLATYAVLEMGWTKAQGALLTSVFWISFASFRFVSIFLVKVVKAVQLVVICLALMVPSLLGLVLASLWQQDWGVWLSNAVGGAAMSAVFASALSWMNAELIHVTGRVTSYVILAASVGPMLNPLILGHLIEQQGPIWIAYVLLGEAILSFTIFLGLLLFARLYLQPKYGASGKTGNDVIISFTAEDQLPQNLTSSLGGKESTCL